MKKYSINMEIIKAYMKENGLSIAKFCQKCGISPSTFYRMTENKEIYLTAPFKISRTMGVPLHCLFKEEF